MRYHRHRIVPAVFIIALLAGCGGNPNPNVTPQAKIAHHGTTVLNTIAELEKGVTAAATANPQFVPAARQITAIVEQINAKAGTLGEALRAYDAATTLDLRRISEAQVQEQVAAINQLLGQILNVQTGNQTVSAINTLVGNVLKVVSTLSAELARGMTPAGGTQ